MRVYLKIFGKEYVDKTFEWVKDKELRRLFLIRSEASRNKHIEYWNRKLTDPTQKVYAIFVDGRHVGNCGIKDINLISKQAETWIYIGESDLRNKGIGSDSIRLLLKECFEKLKLKRLYLYVADFNIAAIRLYERNGFSRTASGDDMGCRSGRRYKILRMELEREKWM